MAVRILEGDAHAVLRSLPAGVFQCCVTSPPYFGLRDYGVEGQVGLEATPAEYVAGMVAVFREVRRVLKDDGTLWLNIGDSYARDSRVRWDNTMHREAGWKSGQAMRSAPNLVRDAGFKPKDLLMIPARLALALQDDGWWLRSDIIWHKTCAMPESVKDRPTAAYEHVLMLTRAERYFYDAAANGPNVWSIAPASFKGAHFAVMPDGLAERCIKAGSRPGDAILDPFGGAGTTGLAADRLGRNATLVELKPDHADLARQRIEDDAPLLSRGAVPQFQLCE